MTLKFTIPGPPRGKGRVKFARRGKHVATYTPAATAAYENLAALAATEVLQGRAPTPDAVFMTVHAFYPIPKSASKKRRADMLSGAIFPTVKPDLDNVVKAILDGINGVVFVDDAQVVTLGLSKVYSEAPRVEVTAWKAAPPS